MTTESKAIFSESELTHLTHWARFGNSNQLCPFMEDIGAEVERRPLVSKLPVSSPVMRGSRLWDFSTQTARVLVSLQEADIKRD